MKMNYDQILDKPFLVTTVDWTTSNVAFTELWRLPFPSSIMSNSLAAVPFNASTFFNARMCMMLQVSGTPMHQGLLLVAAVPHGTPRIDDPNQILSAPHVFLNATESTSVCLECPMYTPCTTYRTYDAGAVPVNQGFQPSYYGPDVFDLVFYVMNTLAAASGSSTTVSISVHNIFKEANFYVPKVGNMAWQAQSKKEKSKNFLDTLWRMPTTIMDDAASGLKSVAGDIIDYTRSWARVLTGFHNPNIPHTDGKQIISYRNFPNNVDIPVRLEVLDNHALYSRIYDDYYFRTDQDEMDLRFLLSKPVFVGKFNVLSTNVAGKNLFAYPMTPMVEALVSPPISKIDFYSPMRTLYEVSRFWRGSLKLHIQAVCTNFHFCKIVVLKQYAQSAVALATLGSFVPQYNNIHNLNTDTLEFSAGGQIHTIDLPFCSNLNQLECTKDYMANVVSHGVVYGYLVQPLTYNSNVPTTISFNVYISGGDDLEFSGYSTDNYRTFKGTEPSYPGVPNFAAQEKGIYEISKDGSHTGRILMNDQLKKETIENRKINFQVKKEDIIIETNDSWEELAEIVSVPPLELAVLNDSVSACKADTCKNAFAANLKSIKRPVKGQRLKWKKESTEEATSIHALVEPSTQIPLLNKKKEETDKTMMSFRPNTSVRDYLRIMYPQTTLTYVPSAVRGVFAVSLSNFFQVDTQDADAFLMLTSLYLGLSGGLKFKVKIMGATCASVMYAPPSTYVVNASVLRVLPTTSYVPIDTSLNANFLDQSTFVPLIKSFTAPQVEMQDYTRPFGASINTTNIKPSTTFELEFAIPNMNMNNFVGNAYKWANGRDVENDMGTLYFSIEAASDGVTFNNVSLIPFIALNDEARLGFQVYCPRKTIARTTSTDFPSRSVRSSIYHTEPIAGTMPPAIPLSSLTTASYYFNST